MPLKKNFIYKELNDEYMLIPVEGDSVSMSKVFNLNEVGATIYKALKEKDDIEYVTNVLTKEYNVEYNLAKQDVIDFINNLKDRGIYE